MEEKLAAGQEIHHQKKTPGALKGKAKCHDEGMRDLEGAQVF
jgi:hypothetical protein